MGAEVIILANPYTYNFLKGLTHSALVSTLHLACLCEIFGLLTSQKWKTTKSIFHKKKPNPIPSQHNLSKTKHMIKTNIN